jgi:hypothetical protein
MGFSQSPSRDYLIYLLGYSQWAESPYIQYMKPEDVRLNRVYFEMREVGKYVRVSAIDPITNTEVHIAGDPQAGQETLKRLATRKLRYVIAKKYSDDDGSIIA